MNFFSLPSPFMVRKELFSNPEINILDKKGSKRPLQSHGIFCRGDGGVGQRRNQIRQEPKVLGLQVQSDLADQQEVVPLTNLET